MKKYILIILVLLICIENVAAKSVTSGYTYNIANPCPEVGINLRYLRKDTHGQNDVWVLQSYLQSKNYLQSQPTGFFGAATRRAVIAFQKDNRIEATLPGFVGAATRAKIKELECYKTVVQDTNLPTPTVTLSASSSTIRLGQSTTLSWSSRNATSCYGSSEFPSAYISATSSGSVIVSPPETTIYSVRCYTESSTKSTSVNSTASFTTITVKK